MEREIAATSLEKMTFTLQKMTLFADEMWD